MLLVTMLVDDAMSKEVLSIELLVEDATSEVLRAMSLVGETRDEVEVAMSEKKEELLPTGTELVGDAMDDFVVAISEEELLLLSMALVEAMELVDDAVELGVDVLQVCVFAGYAGQS